MHSWIKCGRVFHTTTTIAKTVPKNLKGKTKSSQEWLTRQLNDPYVKKAHESNYRARSAFKLIEMDDKMKLLRPGMTVVECGAAPGAWTQVLIQRINADGRDKGKPKGTVIAVDLLPINPLDGAILLPECDFTSPQTIQKISEILLSSGAIGNSAQPSTASLDDSSTAVESYHQLRLIDLVLSDMAPNNTGVKATDHPRIIGLAKTALKFAIDYGKDRSSFLTKLWDGNETKDFEEELSSLYRKVTRLKPPCSRNDSAEIFIYAKGKR